MSLSSNETPDRAAAGPGPTVVQGTGGLVVKRIGKTFRKRPVVRGISLITATEGVYLP